MLALRRMMVLEPKVSAEKCGVIQIALVKDVAELQTV